MTATKYYCEEMTAVPYACMAKGLSATLPSWLAKAIAGWLRLRRLARWNLRTSYGMAETVHARAIERHEVHPEAAAMWAPMFEQLHDLQFRVLQYRLPKLIGLREQLNCILLHESGQSLATLEWQKLAPGSVPESFATLEFNSYPSDDPEVLTAAINPEHLIFSDAFKLPFVDAQFLSNQQPLRKIFSDHQKRTANRSTMPVDPSQALTAHLEHSDRRFAWLLQTGLLRPLSHHEIARCTAMKSD